LIGDIGLHVRQPFCPPVRYTEYVSWPLAAWCAGQPIL
jgi:hypothetical protein